MPCLSICQCNYNHPLSIFFRIATQTLLASVIRVVIVAYLVLALGMAVNCCHWKSDASLRRVNLEVLISSRKRKEKILTST